MKTYQFNNYCWIFFIYLWCLPGKKLAFFQKWIGAKRARAMPMKNSSWPNDMIWQQRSGSTLAQVMAYCLMAPRNYLYQWWMQFHKRYLSHQSLKSVWKSLTSISIRSPRGQWVNRFVYEYKIAHYIHKHAVRGNWIYYSCPIWKQ